MEKWLRGSVFGLIIGVGLALSFGVFASDKTETRNVTISVSGLPDDRIVDVWGDSNKIVSFQSNQPIQQVAVPSSVDKIEVKSHPVKKEVQKYNEQLGKVVSESAEPGVRYVTEQSKYDLTGTENVQVVFKKQYGLNIGVSLTGGTFGGSEGVLKNVKFSPVSEDGYYDAGTTVTVTAPNGGGILFGHWVIKDASSGNVNSDIREFSSAEGSLEVTLDHPINLFGRFVGEWKKLPSQQLKDGEVSDAIVVKNLVDGQKVIIVQNGKAVLEKSVEEGATEAVLSVGSEKQFDDAQILITAPDGKTVVFESPKYEKLQAGDQFFY